MTTSDFPALLEDAQGKALRVGFEQEISTLDWTRSVLVDDFKSQKRRILGSAPDLELVLEHGKYRQGVMDEEASVPYVVKKYGRIVSLTYEALTNDDLSAFLRVQPALGIAARRLESDLVYQHLLENAGAGPTMQDSNPLFDDANHGNVTDTFAALDANALSAARMLLRRQTAVGGGQLNLNPIFSGARPSPCPRTRGNRSMRSSSVGRLLAPGARLSCGLRAG
jgi:hypothetical protein